MRRFLIIAIVAVLMVSGGIFAYTYTTATATISVSAPASDFASITAANLTGLAPTVFGKYTGTWSAGTLFTVTPAAAYTGDLSMRVYLVNSGALNRYYEHLNMTVKFLDSADVVVDEQGIDQLLTLQNSEVLFTWANGTGTGPYKVQLTGGSYRLHPWKSLSGGSVQPQLYCEIVQR
ncbi:MAG: hypothetical protein HY665_01360 [Chloroflexi bacterium]|nr:hypothetical protein [Chloroflexota bacterium]